MPIAFNAGEFSAETWPQGHPMWVTIKYGDKELRGIHHSGLKDLAYVIERMRASMRAALPDGSKHEMD